MQIPSGPQPQSDTASRPSVESTSPAAGRQSDSSPSSTKIPLFQCGDSITPAQIEMFDVIDRTWEIFKMKWGTCVGMFMVYVIIYMGCNLIIEVISRFSKIGAGDAMLPTTVAILTSLLISLFQIWLQIGLCLFFLKIARGERGEISDLFAGSPYFVSILSATIAVLLLGLFIFAGFAIPGLLVGLMISKEAMIAGQIVGSGTGIVAVIVFSLYISQFYYLIIDKNLGPIDAIRVSVDVMSGNKTTLFLTYLITGLAGISLAILTCGLGFLVAIPFMTLMAPVIYLAITEQPTADRIVYEMYEK